MEPREFNAPMIRFQLDSPFVARSLPHKFKPAMNGNLVLSPASFHGRFEFMGPLSAGPSDRFIPSGEHPFHSRALH